MVLVSFRDIGVFWLRLGMYVALCVALGGTIYFQLSKSWSEATARGGLMFFTVGFLTFMSISGFQVRAGDMPSPAPQLDVRVQYTTPVTCAYTTAGAARRARASQVRARRLRFEHVHVALRCACRWQPCHDAGPAARARSHGFAARARRSSSTT
jgi:hypothetical protein